MSEQTKHAEQENIQELIKALKETILELRSLIDDFTNPLLMTQTALQKQTTIRKQKQTESTPVSTYTSPTSPTLQKTPEPKPQIEAAQITPKPSLEKTITEQKQEPLYQILQAIQTQPMLSETSNVENVSQLSLGKVANLLRLIYELQTRVPPEYLLTLTDILRKSGLIDDIQKETLDRIIELGKISYSYGLGVDESIAILAAMAKELGLDVANLTEELVKSILMRRRGAESWENQQQ